MGVTLTTAARNAACDAIVDLIDVSGPGTIELKTAASTVAGTSEAATLTFSNPAFGAASTGVATASAITSDSSAAGGTVGYATVFDGASAAVFQCLVGTSGSDINLTSVVIAATETVSISAMTFTIPAS